jgi:DNA modification methylase
LRSYGTQPVIWGNHNGCEHQWADAPPRRNRWVDDAPNSPKQLSNTGTLYNASGGAYCECGAWRGELGLEPTPELYVQHLVEIFREVRRVLRKDGTLWLNLGDSYATGGGAVGRCPGGGDQGERFLRAGMINTQPNRMPIPGLKPKDLVGIPWMVALALRADGWYLRSDIIWSKSNPMPESVTDRPTRAHEYIFLLSKSERYFYDHEAIKEPASWDLDGTGTDARKARQRTDAKSMPTDERNGLRLFKADKQRGHSRRHAGFNERWDHMEREEQCTGLRNKRDVWNVAPAVFPEAHFATYPPKLIEPCILAGSPAGGIVLDPFAGSGTTGKVAIELGRKAILIEPKAEYIEMIKKRCQTTIGLPLEFTA